MNSEVMKDIGDFLSFLFPGVPIIQSQVNFVPMPEGRCITMSIISDKRLATNIHAYNDTGGDDGTESITRKSSVTVQIDFFGDGSETRAHDFATAFYDDYGFTRLKFKPLSVTDPRRIPFIDDKKNWFMRYMCEADVQVNRETVLQQQFFDKPNFQQVDGTAGITPVDPIFEV